MKRLFKLLNYLGLTHRNTESAVKNSVSAVVLNEAIERVVDGIEPKMRFVSGYQKILKNSVATSLVYISGLVDSIPGPLFINSKTYSTDPQVCAYFATVADVQAIFSDSSELRKFFEAPENSQLDEAYTLLCMNETEKTVLGLDLHNDMICRDVIQTALNFSDHKILSPAITEADVRKGVKQCIFDGLITHALQQIVDLKQQKQQLEIQRGMLKTRLKNRQSQGGGLSSLLAEAIEANPAVDIEQQISENENSLQELPASWDAPRYYLHIIQNTLAQPENFISLKVKIFNMTNMGIVPGNDSSQTVNTVHLNEISIANVLQRVVAIVCYPRNEMLPRQEFKLNK